MAAPAIPWARWLPLAALPPRQVGAAGQALRRVPASQGPPMLALVHQDRQLKVGLAAAVLLWTAGVALAF